MKTIGIIREEEKETRVSFTPETAKKWIKKGYTLIAEKGCGERAYFLDAAYQEAGVQWMPRIEIFKQADLLLAVYRPKIQEVQHLRPGSFLIGLLAPYLKDDYLEVLKKGKIHAVCMELIPRTSRAQSMDVLSSQANIAGYRAVIEASAHYGRFFPLMMTSAGSSKAAKVVVLGAGVAGLQAIATAKRLGAQVEGYDIRPEVKEQVLSLGAKWIELKLPEQGSGSGGYARELSEETKAQQQNFLAEHLKKADILISTASVPGKKAPLLISKEVVSSMRPGSVVIDLAASSGGNCALTQVDELISYQGVKIVGWSNYPALIPADASHFYAQNVTNFLNLLVEHQFQVQTSDDILNACVLTDSSQELKR